MSTVWAFLISVAEYKDESANLAFVHGDNAYIKHGLINGVLIPEDHIIICGSNDYVKYSDFQAMISSYANVITSADRVIIYFSGHGGGTPFSLRFSDEDVEFSKFCDEIDVLSACAKIFILDCCYSGNGEVPELTTKSPSYNLFDYARSGYAIFASSNAGHSSTKHPEKAVSLYTYCFSRALCTAKTRNGKLSLIDVAKCAACGVDYIARENGISLQHPVFKCQIPEGVLFSITEAPAKEVSVYSSSHDNYDIYSTSISHSPTETRCSVFAIAKGKIDEGHIAQYTSQILQEIASLWEFGRSHRGIRFEGESEKVIFVYWGKSETDIIWRNWIYRSTWADPTSRKKWYRLDKNSKIVLDIWISIIPHYDMLGEFYQKNMISDSEYIKLVHEIADPLLIAANEVVRYFEEYENGDIPECAFMQASAEPFRVIQNCWQKMRHR